MFPHSSKLGSNGAVVHNHLTMCRKLQYLRLVTCSTLPSIRLLQSTFITEGPGSKEIMVISQGHIESNHRGGAAHREQDGKWSSILPRI